MNAGSGQRGERREAGGVPSWASRLIALLLVAATALLGPQVAAQSRQASMVIDANTGHVLHAQAADEPRYPASLTKMMTLYLVFEAIEQGRLKPSTPIRISPHAAATAPSKLGLEAGAEISVAHIVQALIVKSANDMAVAVAEHIAGSEAKFAELMTRKARQLGMNRTTFRNPHGLPDPGQVTTARDMLTLAMRLNDDFPQHYRLFASRTFTYGGIQHRNHNTMLASYRGMDGLKTGYTGPSGFNLVASVRRDGRHVVAVVFGGSTAATRNALMRSLLDRAMPRAATEKSRRPAAIARAPRPKPVPEPRPAPRLVEPVAIAVPPPATTAAPVDVARVRPVPVVAPPAPALRQATRPTTPEPQQPPLRGTLPSTLQAQAERLQKGERSAPQPQPPAQPQTVAARPSAPPAYRLNGPAAPSGLMIQIGAYASETEARRHLDLARTKAPAVVGRAAPVTQPVTSGTRQLYRARFSGFDAAGAANACLELRRHQIDCFVAQPGG